ncbi:MAG: MBL fold metallo-hydrolase [Bacillota bacterium]
MTQDKKLFYVSNAGILLQDNNNKILIDGLCDSKMPMFKNPPAEIRQDIINGSPPYNNIDVMLFTHHHSDHFDSLSTSKYLSMNKETFVISTPEVVSRINSHRTACSSSLIELENCHSSKRMILKEIAITAIPLTHDGKDYKDVLHFGYLVETNTLRILHIGDAEPSLENFERLKSLHPKIDLLFVPFPFIGIPSRRKSIKEYINPSKIAVIHLPHQHLDAYNWIELTKKNFNRVRDNYIETVFLEELGSFIEI